MTIAVPDEVFTIIRKEAAMGTTSEILLGFIFLYNTLLFILCVYAMFWTVIPGMGKSRIICGSLLTFIAFFISQVPYQHFRGDRIFPYEIPMWLLYIIMVLLTIAAFIWLRHIRIWRKTNISNMSVKEAFDILPTGLCCYTEDGRPILTNERMDKISEKLFGTGILNAETFREKIDKPIMPIDDTEIVSFSRVGSKIGETDVNWLVAADISEEYKLTKEIKLRKKTAEKVNLRLKTLMSTIEYVTMSRELLEMKIALHDNIGQSLLITKRWLLAPESIDEKDMLSKWELNMKHLIDEGPESWQTPYYVIGKEADLLGIDLQVIGELPTESSLMPVVDTAISTHMINTLKHTNAKKAIVKVTKQETESPDFEKSTVYMIQLTNDGEKPASKVVEKGGLLNLRREVESIGGTMEILSEPQFIINITLTGGEHVQSSHSRRLQNGP